MSYGKTCGKCMFFKKVRWNDRPGDIKSQRNGVCERYGYNINSDGTYAQDCKGYKAVKYKRK